MAASFDPSDTSFDPDWCVCPGDTLQDWRQERGLHVLEAALACRLPPKTYRGIEGGDVELTMRLCLCLARGTGTSAGFWWRREVTYRRDLALGKVDVSRGKREGDRA